MNFPDKVDQVEAILSRIPWEFALRFVAREPKVINGRERLTIPYEKVFNITKLDIKNYLKERYRLKELVPIVRDLNPPYPEKEVWALKLENGYEIYTFDLGKFAGKRLVPDRESIWNYYVDYISSGSGVRII